MSYVIAIDQGTTGSTVLVFDRAGRVVGRGYSEFTQHYPKPGWVEHDADEISTVTLKVLRQACRRAGIRGGDVAAIGITNQRETTVLWDRRTGRPVHRAIVWQDRRTADACAALRAAGHEALVRQKDRARARPVLLRDEGALAPRAREGGGRPRRAAWCSSRTGSRSTPAVTGT